MAGRESGDDAQGRAGASRWRPPGVGVVDSVVRPFRKTGRY